MARGNIVERTKKDKNGRPVTVYGIRYDGPPDPATGQRKQQWKGGFEKKRDAENALAEAITEVEKGESVHRSKETVASFLDRWLEGVRANLRPQTVQTYTWAVERHIKPHIGGMKMQHLEPRHLNKLFGDLREAGTGASSVNYAYVVLRIALGEAEDEGLIVRNPAVKAKRPRPGEKKEMQVWTAEQVRKFLAQVEDDRLYAAFLLTATTGMRRGEVLGLRWRDLDLAANRLTVNQSLTRIGGKPMLQPPKTKQSHRTIALDERTTAVLIAHKVSAKAVRELLGRPAPAGNDLIFQTVQGEPIDPSRFYDMLIARAKAAGVPRLTPHGLRHTWATLALKAGEHPRVVQERLGHSSITITLQVYSHVLPGLQAEAAEHVAALIFEESEVS